MTGSVGHWHLQVGDPNPMGWAIFMAYFAAATACYRASRISLFGAQKLAVVAPSEAENQRRLAFFWLGVCAAMVLLGLNKQLDLQTLLIDIGRGLAQTEGWYEQRRRAKTAFLLALTLGSGTLGAGLAYAMRRVLRRIALSLVGLCTLAVFIVVRAATFEHLRTFHVGSRPALISALELGGILLVGLGAHRASAGAGKVTA